MVRGNVCLLPRISFYMCNWLTFYLGVTWAPGAWIYCGEVFPLKYRAKGVGLAAAGNWAYVPPFDFCSPLEDQLY